MVRLHPDSNGLIIDGTGATPSGDVLISGQRIVAVGADAGASCSAGATVEKSTHPDVG